MRDGFIDRLAETGNVSAAARALGINRMTAYGWRDDPHFAARWDSALDVARQGLRERVVETACAMGVGRWVPTLDPVTDEPVLDEEFELVMRFETDHVDARVLMKLMDKTIRSEDGAPVAAVRIDNHVHAPPPAQRLVTPAVDPESEAAVDAEFEEVPDVDA